MEQAVKTGGELHESAVLSILHITKSTPQKYFSTMLANPGSHELDLVRGDFDCNPCSGQLLRTRCSCKAQERWRGEDERKHLSNVHLVPPDSNATNRALPPKLTART